MIESSEQCLHPTALECICGLNRQMNKLQGEFSTIVQNTLNNLAFSIGIEGARDSHDHLIPYTLIGAMRSEIARVIEHRGYDTIAKKLGDPS